MTDYRALVPLFDRAIPLNHCSQAPLNARTRAAAETFLGHWNQCGMDWDGWIAEVERCRAAFARLINAGVDEIAICTSVSHAASAIASALNFPRERDTIVTCEAEFPTVGHVWMAQERRGARVHWIPVRDGVVALDDWWGAVTTRTRLVSATHAYYLNGVLQDVAAIAKIAHDHGALMFVDAYQSLGVVPMDVKGTGIDLLASGTLKFLLGTPGIAFLYVRRDLIPSLEPLVTGWFGRANPFAFDARRLDWSASASRFDAGTPPLLPAYISRAGLDLLHEAGRDFVYARMRLLTRYLMAGATARGLRVHGASAATPKTPSTGIVVADAAALEAKLRRRGIIASARGPVIRLAPHFYNTEGDIDLALDALVAEGAASR